MGVLLPKIQVRAATTLFVGEMSVNHGTDVILGTEFTSEGSRAAEGVPDIEMNQWPLLAGHLHVLHAHLLVRQQGKSVGYR